jgi:CheY-like chemotaxis protein
VTSGAVGLIVGGRGRHGLSILVAEDSAGNRVLVEAFLRDSPHTITFADDGRHTLELFMAGEFDLVLMDIQMPLMNGLEVTRAIRAFEAEGARRATPVIAVTANSRPEDTEMSRAAGCNDHLSKPISKLALLQAIARFEGQAMAGGASREPAIEVDVPEGLEALIPAYLEARRRDVGEAAALLARGDFDGLATIGHNMKGTGSSYGFRLLTELGASLELSALAGDRDRSEQHLETLHTYLTRVHQEV